MSKTALLVIDLQNDYFINGKYPLWNSGEILINVKAAIRKARIQNMPVILIKHEANPEKGMAPFFNRGTEGVEIHPDILAEAGESEVVVKSYADGFFQTNLQKILEQQGVEKLLICGMMTQNCVTHTAISESAKPYDVSVLADCCTTVDEMIHKIALNAISTRIPLVTAEQVL